MRKVVVTGLGVVSPIGIGQSAFFAGLAQAKPGIAEIRSFDASTFDTRIAGEVKNCPAIPAWVEEPERQALQRDPKSQFAVVAAEEAVDDAFAQSDIQKIHAPERISAFIGAGLEIFHPFELAPMVKPDHIDGAAFHALLQSGSYASMQIPAHIAAKLCAQRAQAQGRLAVNLSACAAGTQAIGEAFLAIADGSADMAIAGGYDSMVNPLGLGGFCLLDALSRANHLGAAASRPFDAQRDGFVMGEGSGMCILEEAQIAKARGAKIYAQILGYASSLDAYRVADPRPDQDGAVRSMRLALTRAGLAPLQIDYINAHGTGTRKNDPTETRAIRKVFQSAADSIPVSSIKGQIGHLIGAAGAVEFISGVFALQKQIIPATLNLENPDPECDLDYVPQKPRAARVRRFLSNSFGFGGQNASIIAGEIS